MAKSKVFKNCLALLLITLVAGLALAVVNEITAKPISEAENKAKMAAYESVFSGVEFEEINSSDKLIKAENDSAPVQNASVDDVLRAVLQSGRDPGPRAALARKPSPARPPRPAPRLLSRGVPAAESGARPARAKPAGFARGHRH